MISALPFWEKVLIIFLGAGLILSIIYLNGKDKNKNNDSNPSNNKWAVLSVVLLVILMLISGYYAPKGSNWILVLFSLFLFFMVLGTIINGRLSGVLIDERNQMSLSRFQMVLWTLIIVSGFLTIALVRIKAGVLNPLDIGVPEELWALLGIATTALVGTPLLLTIKKDKDPTKKEIKQFNEQKQETTTSIGIIPVNGSINEAKFADMFRGDELATMYSVNMAKVQMFFFTVIAALSYAVLLYNSISTTKDIAGLGFPLISTGFVAVLAISNGGYLTNKGIDQTATDQNGGEPPTGPTPDDKIPPQDQNPPIN
jgi:hypothetical protein